MRQVRSTLQIPVTPFAFPANDAGKNPEDSARTAFAPTRPHSSRLNASTELTLQWMTQSTTQRVKEPWPWRTNVWARWKPNFSRPRQRQGRGTEAIDRERSRTVEGRCTCAQPKEPEASTTTRFTHGGRQHRLADKEASCSSTARRRGSRPPALSCPRRSAAGPP